METAYSGITAIQYDRLKTLLPVIHLVMIDGLPLEEGFALADELYENHFGAVYHVAFRLGNKYYLTEANIRQSNHHYIRRSGRFHNNTGFRARSLLAIR